MIKSFAALIVVASWIPSSAHPTPQGWPSQLVVEATISEADRADLGVVGSVAFARAGQLVLVAEILPVRVRVFDRSLKPLRELGGEGSGPGEYRRPVVTANGDSAIVYDAGLGRVIVFSSSKGTLLDEWTTQVQFGARGAYRAMVAVDDRGNIVLHVGRLAHAGSPAEGYVRFGEHGRVQDTLFVAFNKAPTVNPLAGAGVFRVGDPGGYVRARLASYLPDPLHDMNGAYSVSWSGSGSDVLRGGTAATPVSINLTLSVPGRDQRVAHERRIISALTSRDLPEQEVRRHAREHGVFDQVPILEGLSVDRTGRIWAWQGGRHPDSLIVTAVGPGGAPAADLTISRAQWRSRDFWGADVILAGEDDSTGEPLLVRARLRR
jgi:hypothetical protein